MDDSNTNKSNSSTCMDQSFTKPLLLGTTGSFVRASLICILIIAAFIANIFVCLAVYKQRSARRITRYFIVNLCVADVFVTGISMPIWLVFLLYGNKSASCLLGETFIVIWTHVDILCGTASILSLTSISVDRYIAVTKPYSYVRFMTGKRALQVIGGIWIYSMTVASLLKPLRKFDGAYALFIMCVSFLLPLFIIIAAYGSMFRVAMRHTRDKTHVTSAESHRHHKTFKRDLKAAKTIGFVIGTFLCCWTPFIFVSVGFAFFPSSIDQVGASLTKWLSYLNAVLSPVVYTCVDKQLRCLVWRRLCCLRRKEGFSSSKDERSFAHSDFSRSTPLTIV